MRLNPSELARFRRGAVFMFIVGAMMLLGGGVCLAIPLLPEQFWTQTIDQVRSQGRDPFPPGATVAEIKRTVIRQFVVIGLIGVVLGAAEVVLGSMVFRGQQRATAVSAALSVVLLGGVGLVLLFYLIAIVVMGAAALGMFFILLIPAALIVVQYKRLAEALRGGPAAPAAVEVATQPQGATAMPPPLPLSAQLPPGEGPILEYNFAAAQRLPPPPAGPAR